MKILSIGNFTTGWDGSICDEEHIADALERMGHEVARQQREDEHYDHKGVEFDFILIAQWDGYPADLMDKLEVESNHQCPIVYWAFDYQADGQEWHERLTRECDVYLSKPLSDAGKHKNWRWLPQDFAPRLYFPNWLSSTTTHSVPPYDPKPIDVLFTGSWVPWESGKERVEILKAIDKEFKLQINSFTPDQWKAEGFKNVQGPVMDRELPALIKQAKINFSMDHTYAPGYWSDRNAQIMACGGMVLFRHVPLSEAVFRDNIEYFYDKGDCLEKIEKYLGYPNYARAMLADKGYRFALANLMVDNRVKDLLTIVGEFL